jgi:AraC family transcriptional regulator
MGTVAPVPDEASRGAPAEGASRRRIQALPKWRLRRVQAHLEAHIAEALTLARLAEAAGLSRMYFAAQFRAATGRRPHEYLLVRRIARAQAMMLEADGALAHVALAVGFQSQSHFSTVFKRFTGETPAGWRHARRARSAGPAARAA